MACVSPTRPNIFPFSTRSLWYHNTPTTQAIMTGKRAGNTAQLKREIAALQRRLATSTISTQPKNGRRSRRRGVGTAGGGPSLPAAMGSNPQPGRGRVRAGRARVGNGGRIVLSRDELLVQVVTTPDKNESVFSKDLVPSAGVMPFLFRLASCYQRIRWVRAHITWRPACGTATDGIISYGVAFNNSATVSSRDLVTALTPCNDHPVWQSTGVTPLIVPADMLMSRRWYPLNTTGGDIFDKCMGRFCVGLTHDSEKVARSRGEFWISYTVEMGGGR